MARPREPRTTSHFKLTLTGRESVAFRECSGFDSETEVIEHREGSDVGPVRRIPGLHKIGNITLKRGVDTDLTLWKWRDQAVKQGADAARVDGKIEILDNTGAPIATYQFKQGWPIKYEMQAPANEIPLESITIAHEGLERS